MPNIVAKLWFAWVTRPCSSVISTPGMALAIRQLRRSVWSDRLMRAARSAASSRSRSASACLRPEMSVNVANVPAGDHRPAAAAQRRPGTRARHRGLDEPALDHYFALADGCHLPLDAAAVAGVDQVQPAGAEGLVGAQARHGAPALVDENGPSLGVALHDADRRQLGQQAKARLRLGECRLSLLEVGAPAAGGQAQAWAWMPPCSVVSPAP